MGIIKKPETDKTKYLFGRGHIYEPAIREAFSFVTGLKVDEFDYQVVNDRWPHCVANIDGVVWEDGQMGILEIKSTDFGSGSYKSFFEYDEIPEYYYAQVQFYLQVLERDFAYIVCAKDFSEKGMKYFRIKRDDEFGEELMSKMEEYVDRIVKGLPIDDSIVSSDKLIKRKLHEYCGEGDPFKADIKLDHSLESIFREYASLTSEINTLTNEIKPKKALIDKDKRTVDKLKDKIAYEMKDAVSGELDLSDITVKVSFPPLDTKEPGAGFKEYIKTEYPDVYADAIDNCPKDRKVSIEIIEKGDNNES